MPRQTNMAARVSLSGWLGAAAQSAFPMSLLSFDSATLARAFLFSHLIRAQGTEPNNEAKAATKKITPNCAGGPHQLNSAPGFIMLATTQLMDAPAAYPTPTVT